MKFTQAGTIVVSVEGESNDECWRLHFTVSDTGIGIPAHAQAHLFQSFSQADSSTTRQYGGTGLGLAISKRLCELMGGKIWVENQEGLGSTFHFTIRTRPAAAPPIRPNHSDTQEPISRLPSKTLRILLAEDNLVNQKVALHMLRRLGYNADVVGNGREAVEAFQHRDYDIVLMDVQMPELDGIEATRRLRSQLPAQRQPQIVAMTANVLDHAEQGYLQAGMDDYISKPAKPADLARALTLAAERMGERPFNPAVTGTGAS